MDRDREETRKVETIERVFAPRNQYAEAQREMTEEEKIEHAFTYHAPEGESPETRAYAAIRAAGKSLALTILNAAPRCGDRTDAIRKVREAVMTANAAIALQGLV